VSPQTMGVPEIGGRTVDIPRSRRALYTATASILLFQLNNNVNL